MKKDYPRPNKNDSWRTDDWIQSMFPISPSIIECAVDNGYWFDPCPYNPNFNPKLDRDGLKIEWLPRTFVNPPYSNPLPWVKKAIEESEKRSSTIVMLLKHDSSTKWYAELHKAGAKFMMIQGRLKFGTNKGCAFPSILAVLDTQSVRDPGASDKPNE